MDVTKVVENGKVAQNLLDKVNITLIKTQSLTKACHHSRLVEFVSGAAAITARGFGEKKVAKWLN